MRWLRVHRKLVAVECLFCDHIDKKAKRCHFSRQYNVYFAWIKVALFFRQKMTGSTSNVPVIAVGLR